MKISVLDDITINKIAAGEVVERPASVVKELVENSLDAGATQISIAVEDGGLSCIRVIDDGEGMTSEDAKLSLQRHATSKISSSEELFTIETMGFRGEAIPSIAGISKFTLDTKKQKTENGIRLIVEAGKFVKEETIGIPEGTIISVDDLFYNVPARRKFLKSATTELSHIVQIIERFILSHPNIKFTLSSNDKIILRSTGNGKLKEAIVSIYGKEIAKNLLEIRLKPDNKIAVSGFISLPTCLKHNRKGQYFFVNKRSVTDMIVYRAIKDGYKNSIPSDKYPYIFLFIAIDPSQVDVNVHPAKREVRFADNNQVFSVVKSAIENAIVRNSTEKDHSDNIVEDNINININKNLVDIDFQDKQDSYERLNASTENPLKNREFQNLKGSNYSNLNNSNSWSSKLNDNLEKLLDIDQEKNSSTDNIPLEVSPVKILDGSGIPVFQVDRTYIVTRIKGELTLIDQHAAHERVIFEQFKNSILDNKELNSQQLLIPLTLEFTAKETLLFSEYLKDLEKLGFLIEAFGKNTFLVRSVPVEIADKNPKKIILKTFSELIDSEGGLDKICLDDIFKMFACKAAVKAGDSLGKEEIERLILDIEKIKPILTCPHGRPFIAKITSDELSKMFART